MGSASGSLLGTCPFRGIVSLFLQILHKFTIAKIAKYCQTSPKLDRPAIGSLFNLGNLWQLPNSGNCQYRVTSNATNATSCYLGRLAPYLDRPCLRLATPVASSVPRTT